MDQSKVIKFRAWSKNLAIPGSNEFMEYSDQMGGLKKFFSVYPKSGVVLNGAAERFIMRFSGLINNYGEEIYEGDILRHPEGKIADKIVVFEEGCFITKKSFEDDDPCYLFDQLHYHRIGNIYQHKHLMQS